MATPKIISGSVNMDFRHLEKLIEKDETIVLESDVTLKEDEASRYRNGIEIKQKRITIDGAGHSIDGQSSAAFFIIRECEVTLKNITFKNGREGNRILGHNAPLILLDSKTNILNCRFENNKTKWWGGAIDNNGNLKVEKSAFLNNSAGYRAGAIYNSGDATISESTFEKNTADVGGAMLNKGKLTIEKSELCENRSNKDGGGAIYSLFRDVTIEECEFRKNASKRNGGAIASDTGKLEIAKSSFENNTAGGEFRGGAIATLDTAVKITSSTFAENRAKRGGAIFSNRKFLKVEDCTIRDNQSDDIHEFINFTDLDEMIQSGKKDIVLDADVLYSYERDEYPDGIKIASDGILLNANGHEINARGEGRIFECTSDDITIKKATLKGGLCENDGGAIINTGKLNLANVKIAHNISKRNGGAILNTGKLSAEKVEITENMSHNTAGGIFNGGELDMTKSVLSKNTATGKGGAIRNIGDLKIRKSELQKNIAETGGAIYSRPEKMTINECTIEGNEPNDMDG